MNTQSKTRKMNNMDNIILKRKNKLQKILSVLETAYISSDNYDSSDKAFFSGNIESAFKINSKHIRGLPVSLNRNILDIYNLLGDPEREIYLGDWTLMSVKNAIDRYNELCKLDRKDVFDIGYKYMGMGHIQMISCDLNSHLLFYRPDGGSNGYDRQDNLDKLIKNGANDYKKIYFSDWFYKININNNENNIEYDKNYLI